MPRVDLLLRAAGRPVALHRDYARALVLRGERARDGLVRRALRAVGLSAEEEGAVPPPQACAPRLAWAPDAERCDGYALAGALAVIDVKGLLTQDGCYDWWEGCCCPGYEQIGAALRLARADGRVKGILLRIDSPGGLVDGCFELADEIRAGSARGGGKPIWAATSMACSAAYALASACDRIVAQATAYVGSIGVYMLHVDETGWLEELGIKITPIESGARKTDLQPFKPLSEEARADAQAVIDETAALFFRVVSQGRGLAVEAIRAMEGRAYMAAHSDPARSGRALGLVDAIGTDRSAAAELAAAVATASSASPPPPGGGATSADCGRESMEDDMALKDRLAALLAEDGGDAEKLEKIRQILDGEGDDTPGKDDEEETEEEPEPAAAATANPRQADAWAVLDLPEAKGREGLAKSLARKVAEGRLTVQEAKSMLAAAPRASRLDEAMAGRDVHLGAGDPGKADGLAAAVDRLIARQKAAR
ncbi:MAG: S49 family peptidase [Variibacter sp.]|nr:S49 family peptidase [Variibacter sp.]